ncbi:MAG TPA: Xaa-Pro peptidase family protein [Gemmatimonadaceae bacterium]
MHAASGARDVERIAAVRAELEASKLDGLVCALPSNVLMLSGYWPVVGTAVAVIGANEVVAVIAPRDEHEFADAGWANEIVALESGGLDALTTVPDAIREPMRRAIECAHLGGGRIGVESGLRFEPFSYVGTYRYGSSIPDLLRDEHLTPVPADDLLARLRGRLTRRERDLVSIACGIAQRAFVSAAPLLRPGLIETEAASRFRDSLSSTAESDAIQRADGFAFCMSGANSASAYGAYARSTSKRLREGELVLVHCNSYADGYWTDITRTYCLGAPNDLQRAMYDAVLASRDAALATVRAGVRAADVDAAAREVLASRGYGAQFRHSTGHGVGFAAIDAGAQPRLHPASPDVLVAGMVCNVEPAIYIEGYGGIRHCDVVAVTEHGCDVLTPVHAKLTDLIIGRAT